MEVSVTLHSNDKKINQNCDVCHKEFLAIRVSARYCSNACKQIARRDRESLKQRFLDIERMLYEIDRTDHPEVKKTLRDVGRLAYSLLNIRSGINS